MVECILVLANGLAARCWDIVFVLDYGELVYVDVYGGSDLWCWEVERRSGQICYLVIA